MVVVRSASGMDDVAAQIRDALQPRLRARGLAVQRPPDPGEPPRPDPQALTRARRAYENLRPTKAREHVEAWLERVDTTGGAGIDREQLVDALLLKSMAAHAEGDAGAADAAMDRALAIAPELSLDAAQYPPTLRQRLTRRRQARAPSERTPVQIQGVPSNATVGIDGEDVGRGEVRTLLPPGIHLVRVRAPGRTPVGRRVRVGTKPVKLELPLAYDVARVSEVAGEPATALPPELERAVAAAGAAPLVLDVYEIEGRTVAILRDPAADRTVRARASSSPPKPAVLARELAEGIGITPGRMVSERRDESSGAGAETRRVAWIAGGTAAGAAVAVTATLLAVFLSGSDGANQWRATGRRVGE